MFEEPLNLGNDSGRSAVGASAINFISRHGWFTNNHVDSSCKRVVSTTRTEKGFEVT